jgi:hypothetical protein
VDSVPVICVIAHIVLQNGGWGKYLRDRADHVAQVRDAFDLRDGAEFVLLHGVAQWWTPAWNSASSA